MKLKIKNLGIVENAEIDLSKNLIIFTGYNNTGKTYLNYLLYGLYKIPFGRIQKQFFPLVEIEDLSNETICLQTDLNKLFTEKLDTIKSIYENLLKSYCKEIFASNDVNPEISIEFEDDDLQKFKKIRPILKRIQDFATGYSGVSLLDDVGVSEINNDVWKMTFDRINSKNQNYNGFKDLVINIIKLNVYKNLELILFNIASFNHIQQRDYNNVVHFIPAERATLNQYSQDIIFNRKERYEENNSLYPLETDENKKSQIPEYPFAISEYIKLVYNLYKKAKQFSIFNHLALELEEKMLNGKVFVTEQGIIKFRLPNNKILELYETSSTVKSLAVLVLYLRHIAYEGDVIFIDEPELNLHPQNQLILARFLAKLVNYRFKVIISTHSDYITKELSSLVLMSKDFPEKQDVIKKYEFDGNEFIDKEKIALYSFEKNGTVENKSITEYGIEIKSFDNVIGKQSQMFDYIYFTVSNDE